MGKLSRGEVFPNLDMLTTLLPCRQRKDLRRLGEKPGIEVLESGMVKGEGAGGDPEGEEGRAKEDDVEEDIDWGVDQNFSSKAEVE